MRLIRSLSAVALACVPTAVLAAPGSITYDCDTAANHFSELVLPTVVGSFSVSGNVRLNALAGSAEYVPLVRIQIGSPTNPGQPPETFAGFSLSALPLDPKKAKSGA
jgi:hypothetical protein